MIHSFENHQGKKHNLFLSKWTPMRRLSNHVARMRFATRPIKGLGYRKVNKKTLFPWKRRADGATFPGPMKPHFSKGRRRISARRQQSSQLRFSKRSSKPPVRILRQAAKPSNLDVTLKSTRKKKSKQRNSVLFFVFVVFKQIIIKQQPCKIGFTVAERGEPEHPALDVCFLFFFGQHNKKSHVR